ncbi:MAG: MtnX-like HAD-IB family phosphatase [Chloroflexota bacterium]
MKPRGNKTLVQSDFDGTITSKDVAFLILDRFAPSDWRKLYEEYRQDKIKVGEFTRRAFALVHAGKNEILDYVRHHLELRAGLPELVQTCRERGFRFVIVSNGLDFYIETILNDLGLRDIEFHAAETRFNPRGLEVRYVSPAGEELEDAFKEAYTRLFLSQGYRTVYVGDGYSDFSAANLAHHVFAIDRLLEHCQTVKRDCVPFRDLKDIAGAIRRL